MKKILPVLLFILILILTACGNKDSGGSQSGDSNPNHEQRNADGNENANLPENASDDYVFPALNCNSESFTFLNVETNWDFYTIIVHEAQTGEVLDDAIFARNMTVEEKFNVKLKERGVLIDEIEAEIKKTILAGDTPYDAAYCPAYSQAPIGGMITQNLFYDLYDIPGLQLEKPWWNQTINQECAIGSSKKLYFTWCDINIMNLQSPWCVYINEDMMKNLGLDLPYNLVKEGKWTLDEFHKYAKAGSQLNGQENFKWSPGGTAVFGYTSYEGGTRALLVGSGERFISRDSDGMPYLSIETRRFYDICDKIAEITNPPGIYQNANDYATLYHFEYLFRDERTLMSIAEIKASDNFRNMDAAFGIVPIPKYDENQSSYYSSVANPMPVLIVPNTADDIQRTGVILDAMAYLSTKNIAPVFFDITMSQKRLRNDESIEMLHIIKDSVIYDVGMAYGWSSDLYINISDSLDKGKNNAVTQIEKLKDKVAVKIENTMDSMD